LRGAPTHRSRFALALLATLVALSRPATVDAQLSGPCDAWCGVVLGATGLTIATGTLVTRARLTGGISSTNEAVTVWGGSLVLAVGAGVALGGDGRRQERAVYASGIGAIGGALIGTGLESVLGESTRQRKVAAALMGGAAGALLGGVYGALTHDGEPASMLLGVRLPL